MPTLDPLDPALRDLTLAAVVECGARIDEYVASSSWVPTLSLPKTSTFESGWVRIEVPVGVDRDGPIDYRMLVGRETSQLVPFSYADFPTLEALIAYVSGSDFRDRLVLSSTTDWIERSFFLTAVTDLPLSIVARQRWSAGTSFDDLYAERERAWLADRLPVEYWIPLVLTSLELDGSLPLGEGLRLEPISDAMQAARGEGLRFSLAAVPDPVAGAATHALVVGGTVENPGPMPRQFSRTELSLPLEVVNSFFEALRLVTHVPTGYAQVVEVPVGWTDRWSADLPPARTVGMFRRYPEAFDDYGWLRRPNPVTRAALDRLPALLAALPAAGSAVQLAVRRLSLATMRTNLEDTVLDACIGLEALIGTSTEITYRLGMRAAAALAMSPDRRADPSRIAAYMKTIYDYRSAVVHGRNPDKHAAIEIGSKPISTPAVAVFLLRELVLEALVRPAHMQGAALDAAALDLIGKGAAISGSATTTDAQVSQTP